MMRDITTHEHESGIRIGSRACESRDVTHGVAGGGEDVETSIPKIVVCCGARCYIQILGGVVGEGYFA